MPRFASALLAAALLTACDPAAGGGGMSGGSDMADDEHAREPASLAELQVQPPEAIAYKEAGPGDIRVLPESRVCIAEFVEPSLREAIDLSNNIGFRGSIAGPFDRWFLAAGTGSRRESVGQGVTDRHRQAYRESCAWTPENIYIYIYIGLNTAGESYRIELTIRQADKQWVRVVERLEGRRPDITDFPPYRVGSEALAEASIAKDINELSTKVGKLLSN